MPANVRYVFRDGKFYYFHLGVLDVARAWGPRAGAWRVYVAEGRHAPWNLDFQVAVARSWCRPSQRKLSTCNQCRAEAVDAFLQCFPQEALRAVSPYRESNWALLQLLNRCGPPGAELLASTPALALLLAERRRVVHDARLTRLDAVRRALGWKQTRLLERFGFPPRQCVVRVLRKIATASLGVTVLRYLRWCLWRPETLKAASYLGRINRPVVRFLRDPALLAAVTPGFLEEVGQERDRSLYWPYEVQEIQRLAAIRDHGGMPVIRSKAHARELHQDLAQLHAGEEFLMPEIDWENCPFPDPPWPGSLSFAPIRTALELREEAREMSHCAWTYAGDVRDGGCYFYRVLAPERATLCVEPDSGGSWRVREIRGPCNAAVARETLERVRQWLEAPARDSRQLLLFPDLSGWAAAAG